MGRISTPRYWKLLRFPLLIFVITFGLEILIWSFLGSESLPVGWQTAFYGLGFLLALTAAGWSLTLRLHKDSSSKRIQELTFDSQGHNLLQVRLNGLVKLNQLLINAQSEDELVEKSLEIITSVAGCEGGSFVPYDEWGQPLNAYVFGLQSPSGKQEWTDFLSSQHLRERCQGCQRQGTEILENCPLLDVPETGLTKIYCLPLSRNGHPVGVVNLYLPPDRKIDPDLHSFLVLLLNEMAMALEMTRLRNQELTTLHQLQLASGQQEDLESIIKRLVEGLRDTLDYRSSRALFRPAEPRFSGFELTSGVDPWLQTEQAVRILQQAANQGCVSSDSIQFQAHPDGSSLLVLPFSLPEGTVIGAVLLTGSHNSEPTARQMALIDTVTTQAALMVENERRRLETEYRTIIQERVRLAREIHDSLAQTLAYLKLTSAQMQIQLAQGELDRLALNLQHSHDALAEAYTETRQAIDNLRFAPQQDMAFWLDQITRNFERTSGLSVITKLPATLPQFTPEIQAQLVRIIQEALSNVRKHARADTVNIFIRQRNNDLQMDISDNGIGFSSEDIPDLSRHGLRGMRERAELIGADFQITSQTGSGTTIHIEVPINPQETPA